MKGKITTYNYFQKASAIFMILALAWLTVSAAFIYPVTKQNKDTAAAQYPADDNQEEGSKPLPNSTEEKNPASGSLLEEYLHDNHTDEHFFSVVLHHHTHENADDYVAYHGELHAPPPNFS